MTSSAFPPSSIPTSALVIEGLSAEQASHIQTLLEARGVSPDHAQAYVTDLMTIIESGFDSYFASLGTPVCNTQQPEDPTT